jgi:hypothetical protein
MTASSRFHGNEANRLWYDPCLGKGTQDKEQEVTISRQRMRMK